MQRSIATPSLGLALGGGGMKGWAHLGVISVLEEVGLRPQVISGCSAGALIGAFYAFGYSLREMKQTMEEQRTTTLFPLRFDGLGLLSSDSLREYLQGHFGDATFADLKTPFHVICTDIESGREVVVNSGRIVDAVVASCAMPGIFAPVEIDGRLLVDGGLCNNVPVSVLVARGARYTVAVRLHRDVSGIEAGPIRRLAGDDTEADWRSIAGWADRLTRTMRGDNNHLPNGMEVLGRAMEIAVARLEGYRLQSYPPDILIAPPVGHISTLRFNGNKAEIFSRGEAAAREHRTELEKLQQIISRQSATRH